MKHIVAFAGSDSKTSINKQLASYTAKQTKNTTVEVLDLNDYSLPMYGIDYENEHGIPATATQFFEKIKGADGIVLSLAEHNGAYATVFKNIFDWMSRIEGKVWSNVPMFLMATSPGARGGATVLDVAMGRFPFMGGNVVASFSLPNFNDTFSNQGIKDEALRETFENELKKFETTIHS